MSTQTQFQQNENELVNLKFNNMTEQKILKFWRQYEPKRVEQLISKGNLRKTLEQKADALFTLQQMLMKTENLEQPLAKLEAWNRLMRIEEDAEQEAQAFGMTTEEYLDRP